MQTRYNSPDGGFRIDTDEGIVGEAIDIIYVHTHKAWKAWLRDADGRELDVDLSIENIHDLREWCTSVLVNEGLERFVTVAMAT